MTARRAAGLRAAAWRGTAGLGAAALLRSSFAAQAGSTRFYLLTAGLAGTWTGGALGAGPIRWRGEGWRIRPGSAARVFIVVPVVTGAATFAVFYGAARAARRHRTLRRAIASVLRYAEGGSTLLVVLIASGSGRPKNCSSAVPCDPDRAHSAPPARLRRIDRRYRQPGAHPGRPDHQRDLRLAASRHRRSARPGPHPRHLVRTHAALPPAAVP
ncbi:MAG TPA: hypothetical protein VJ370_00195 [Streptosporangiaceae bacterium]|nr:hypothetical protein [Streptosporangiaceae bacterium]